MVFDLPCDGNRACMKCKAAAPEAEVLQCVTCTTPWHFKCLSKPPQSMEDAAVWVCPDCSRLAYTAGSTSTAAAASTSAGNAGLVEDDEPMTEQARQRQRLLTGEGPSEEELFDTPHGHNFLFNEDRPETAFTTKRAKKKGKANASCGQIFVTVPHDHFGPIPAQNDRKRNRGVLVGDIWADRMECRQWGAHLPHIAGIAGQSGYGAQSVALSGGYEDDEDHGEWFLYTGSGGRDLSGNKRTNKTQSFDQKFEKSNEALRVSCTNGYPVRVVRSHKEKHSSYAPKSGVRYDGIYRIEKCWRKTGIQGHKVCRYLFVRCDNEPSPWTSDEHGDRPRPMPSIEELDAASDITVRNETPAWDYDEEHGWNWVRPPPVSRKAIVTGDHGERKKRRKSKKQAQNISPDEQLLKDFGCSICGKLRTDPLSPPCGHSFCKSCLLGSFPDQASVRDGTREDGHSLRAQEVVKKCPCCEQNITDFLQNPQVNREMLEDSETMAVVAAAAVASEEAPAVAAAADVETEEATDLHDAFINNRTGQMFYGLTNADFDLSDDESFDINAFFNDGDNVCDEDEVQGADPVAAAACSGAGTVKKPTADNNAGDSTRQSTDFK